MNPTSLSSPAEVNSIGSAALLGLGAGGQTRILASFSRAFFLSTGGGEIYWVTGADSPPHRRSVQLSSQLPKHQAGDMLDVRGWTVDSHPLRTLAPDHPRVWRAPALPARTITPGYLSGKVRAFYRQFLHEHQPAGWGSLIPLILKRMDQVDAPPEIAPRQAFLTAAWQSIEGMLVALIHHDYHDIPNLALDLVGLGEGLTPSGDDFLGGMFFCLHTLAEAYPGILKEPWNYSGFIEQSEARTNRISFTLLKDHASGHALAPLHLLATGLVAGQPYKILQAQAEDLILVGQSTGWDLLTGFLAGMSVSPPHSYITCLI